MTPATIQLVLSGVIADSPTPDELRVMGEVSDHD